MQGFDCYFLAPAPERSNSLKISSGLPPAGPSLDVVKSLAQIGFSEADLRAIYRENAIRLIPRLAAS